MFRYDQDVKVLGSSGSVIFFDTVTYQMSVRAKS